MEIVKFLFMVDLGVYLWYYISIETKIKERGKEKMRKSYKGLCEALKTAENIIYSNEGLSWEYLIRIFINDQIIEPYYIEVTDTLIAGRVSLRSEVSENE